MPTLPTLQVIREDLISEQRATSRLVAALLGTNLFLAYVISWPGYTVSIAIVAMGFIVPIIAMWLCVYFGSSLAVSRAAVAGLRSLEVRALAESAAGDTEAPSPVTTDYRTFKKSHAEQLHAEDTYKASLDRMAIAFIIFWAVYFALHIVSFSALMQAARGSLDF